MAFAIRAGDVTTRLEDLPIGEFQQIAKRYGVSWFELWQTPASNADAFFDLVELAVRHGGGTLPKRPATVGESLAMISKLLEIVEDDLPSMWDDAVPQEADQTTD